MRFSGATGRIRTSGLPGRRTTTGRYRLALERKFCWLCTFIAKTTKSPLLVVTTGFFDILRCGCTVVVKWWSENRVTLRCFKDDKNYDFNRYFLALLLPSATIAPLATNSAKYIFVREICRPTASAIWTLLASGVSVKY